MVQSHLAKGPNRRFDSSDRGHPYAFLSRRFNSRSTASRMTSAIFSPSAKVALMRSLVPSGNLAGICSKFICVLPILLISPIDGIVDITYIYDINKRSKPMDLEDLREQLQTLLAASPETGEQWAEICRLEQEIVDAEQNAAERAYQRQCERFYGGGFTSLRDQQLEARRVK